MDGQFDFSDWASDGVETALGLAGLWLLWRLALSPAARARVGQGRLRDWPAPWLDFGLLIWGAFLAASVAATLAARAVGAAPTEGDDGWRLVAVQAAAQLALIAWCLGFRKMAVAGKGFAPTIRPKTALAGGAATFLIAVTVVGLVSLVWSIALQLAGVQPEAQDTVEFFAKLNSPTVRVLFVLFAAVGAPVAEELVFRGGLFHFCRLRLPRWAALLLPACLFAALHASLTAYAPLAALGVILSLAYERTGNLAVPMVAHSLFNLHTLAVVYFVGGG
jgi:membrane protease YdiL (CAAX protease family)